MKYKDNNSINLKHLPKPAAAFATRAAMPTAVKNSTFSYNKPEARDRSRLFLEFITICGNNSYT